jgi:hypothetical protein
MTTTSVSETKAFSDCEKKWGFQYLDGIKMVSKAMKNGLDVHKDIETMFKEGREPQGSHEEWAFDFVDQLDPKKITVEWKTSGKYAGMIVNGRYDLLAIGQQFMTLIDWKAPTKKPEQEMSEDTYFQLSIYGYFMGMNPGDKLVEAFPEWKTANVANYNRDDAIKFLDWMRDITYKRDDLLENVQSSAEIQGYPSWKCWGCNYYDICPDRKPKGTPR